MNDNAEDRELNDDYDEDDEDDDLHDPDDCGEHFECPICGFSHCPVEPEHCCAHWLGTASDDDEPIDLVRGIPDFSGPSFRLCRKLRQLTEMADMWGGDVAGEVKNEVNDEIRWYLKRAPHAIRRLVLAALSEDTSSYWMQYYKGIYLVRWEFMDSPLYRSGYHCFHPDARAFAQKIKDDAELALAWLNEHLPSYDEEEDENG